MRTDNRKILICLSRLLLDEIDSVVAEKQVSRSSFVRESLTRNLLYYNEYERKPICFRRDDAEVNERPSHEHDETC